MPKRAVCFKIFLTPLGSGVALQCALLVLSTLGSASAPQEPSMQAGCWQGANASRQAEGCTP